MDKVVNIVTVHLNAEEKFKKFRLASIAGYTVKEFEKGKDRCYIDGADRFINNDFRNIDDVLFMISKELYIKGFNIAA